MSETSNDPSSHQDEREHEHDGEDVSGSDDFLEAEHGSGYDIQDSMGFGTPSIPKTGLAEQQEIKIDTRTHSPKSARRIRNRLAAARMRARQKQHMEELENKKAMLEKRALELEKELYEIQNQNNTSDMKIDMLLEIVDNLAQMQNSILSSVDKCVDLLGALEGMAHNSNNNSNDIKQ